MRKEEFLRELKRQLAGLPKDDINNRIEFYSEMIEDRMDEGLTEEEAVNELGSVESIVNSIAKDTPFVKLIKEKVTPKREIKGWEILLLVLGFPLWLPLVITGIVLAFVAYLMIWVADFVSLTIEFAFCATSAAGFVAYAAYAINGVNNLVPLGAALMSLGGALMFYWVCVVMTKGTLKISGRILTKIKAAFIRKGSNR